MSVFTKIFAVVVLVFVVGSRACKAIIETKFRFWEIYTVGLIFYKRFGKKPEAIFMK
jgi:hypothetical protein